MLPIPVIYENDHLLVIDKPAGIVVNRSESVAQETIQDWAEEKLRIKNYELRIRNDDFYDRSGIVHRLDKETSGLLIIAKNPTAFTALQNQFKERKITKKYLTLVHGLMESEAGEIKAAVGRLPWNRERFGILPGGREAITSFKVIKYINKKIGSFSYLSVFPHTGRTHQIRIHLKYTGHSIVSDKFYAGRKTYLKDLKICPRLFLHAGYLELTDPVNGKLLKLTSDLPCELQSVLVKLENST